MKGEPVYEIVGDGVIMAIVKVAEFEPPAFVAVTVILVAAATTVGVPEIIPVAVLKTRPVGNVPV